jgi:hypothetical protein
MVRSVELAVGLGDCLKSFTEYWGAIAVSCYPVY